MRDRSSQIWDWRGPAEAGAALGARGRGLRRVAPVLAVEIAGIDDELTSLREKAAWYLRNGVEVVWLVLPEPRTVIVISDAGESERKSTEKLPLIASLPGLEPSVGSFFLQIDG